jgi:hypothetical protein
VAHLSDGVLRRMYDEPLAVTEVARGHFNQCDHCQQRFAEIAATARSAQAALAAPAVTVDAGAAFRSVSAGLERPRLAWLPRFGGSPRFRVAGVAALLAASLAVLAFTSPLADVMNRIFSPTHVQTVPITTTAFQGMPDLSNWGTVKVITQPELQQVEGTKQAAGTDLPALDRAKAPAGLPTPQYGRVAQASGTFTFDAAKAQAAAARDGKKSPPLPSNLNGSVLQLTAGPAEFAVYGTIDPKQMANGQVPQLVIAAAHTPVLTSNGATVKQIEDAVLAQPGVSPELAAQVQAIGDPTTTLPIPVPADKASSHSVTLHDGTAATYIGDNTGIAAGLIWIKGNYVYGVAGSLHEADLVAVANSLLGS